MFKYFCTRNENAMIVSFPHTNPVVFSRLGAYDSYQDAYAHEQRDCFLQSFAKGDCITFQTRWSKVLRTTVHTLKVEVVRKGVRHTVAEHSITGECSGGTYSGCHYGQSAIDNRYASGYYVFSCKVENVKDTSSVSILSPEDIFHFIVTVGGEEYESNSIRYTGNVSGTKLLHYNHTAGNALDTIFSVVPKGYDVRLPACFLHPTPGVDREVFESNRRDLELVSATPSENIQLEIGGQRGVPDWWIRNLNHIFHCDRKSIDGVEYELTANASLEPLRTDGYNSSWLRVEMARKKSRFSYVEGAADKPSAPIIDVVERQERIHAELELVETGSTEGGNSQTVREWYIDDEGSGALEKFTFSRVSGTGSQKVEVVSSYKNFTGAAEQYVVYVKDILTDEIIGTITLTVQPWNEGISFGVVGDTLFVKEKLIIN